MENETQALLALHCRMFTLEGIAAVYKQNRKALKLCLKFVKIESKDLNKCDALPPYETGELKHRYEVLTDIIKRLIKAPTPAAANLALEELRILTEKTQEDISVLRERLSPLSENMRKLGGAIDTAAQKLSKKLESGTKVLSDKISETVDELKKAFSDGQEK